MIALLPMVLGSSIVLSLGLLATWGLRHRSAALRHAVIAVAILAALAMPIFSWILPALPIIPWPSSTTTLSTGATLTSGEDVIAAAPAVSSADDAGIAWLTVAGGLWIAGSLLTLAWILTGFIRLTRLRRRCTPITGPARERLDALTRECGVRRPVDLLQSDDDALVLTYGLRTPGIIVPANSRQWTADRWHVVLRHELAHIARGDAALQVVSEALRIGQPWNPLVWIACRRLRQESEFACDDHVLRGGIPATTYATHLLDVAQAARGRSVVWASAPAIAHPSTLERRITAMLKTQQNRTPMTRRGWLAVAAVALGVSLPLAAAGLAPENPILPTAPVVATAPPTTRTPPTPPTTPTPPAPPASPQAGAIAGRIIDQTGGAIPGATVTVTDAQTSSQLTAMSNASGRFTFGGLAPGDYALSVRLPGFKTISSAVSVGSGSTWDRTLTLQIGTLSESITVACSGERFNLIRALFPVVLAEQAPSTPIRVGGQIREPRKTRHVAPACPSGLDLSGAIRVVMRGKIGTDGLMTDILLDDSAPGVVPPAALVNAVREAVRQWEFTATLLNGQPVEVDVTITTTFRF